MDKKEGLMDKKEGLMDKKEGLMDKKKEERTAPELRDYQKEILGKTVSWLLDYHNSRKHVCVEMPTGAGKSHVIAALVKEARENPAFRDREGGPPGIIVLSFQKELIGQDMEKVFAYAPWLEEMSGIWSAAMGRKQAGEAVTFATIGSVYRLDPAAYGWSLAIVDEAHMINNESRGMYRTFLAKMPKVVGFTATPYRMTQGDLTSGKDALFSEIIRAEACSIRALEEAGVLAAPKLLDAAAIRGIDSIERGADGEFKGSSADKVVNTSGNNRAACRAIADAMRQEGRAHCLVFCVSVSHAADCAALLRADGVRAEAVTGETPPKERDAVLASYREGRTEALCNVGVLTTGFDAPETDLIAFLRPTMSAGLYLQMCGRGQRLNSDAKRKRQEEGDAGYAIIDFVGNVGRFGMPDGEVRQPGAEGRKPGGRRKEAPCFYRCPVHHETHPCDMPAVTEEMPDGSSHTYVPCPACGAPMLLIKQCPDCGSDLLVADSGLTGSLEDDLRELDAIGACPVWLEGEGGKRHQCGHVFFEWKECPICGKKHKGKPYFCGNCGYDFIGMTVPDRPKAERKEARLWLFDMGLTKRGEPALRLWVDKGHCIYLTYSRGERLNKPSMAAADALLALRKGAPEELHMSPSLFAYENRAELMEELKGIRPDGYLLEKGTRFVAGLVLKEEGGDRIAWLS